jgi:Mrp family chromosome partitioning ATPase
MVAAQEQERSDLGALAGIIRRRIWLVIVSIIVGIGVALVLSNSQQKQYQSTAVLLFRQVLLDIQLTGTPLQLQSSDPTIESATDVGLVDQENVRAGAAQQLGPPYTTQSLKSHIDISSQGKSNLVGIKATAASPDEAARIANTVANQYLRIASQQTVAEITAAEDRVRSEINTRKLTRTQREGLQTALTKLSVLSSLGPENVHLVQPAVPPNSPSSPKPVRNAIIGGLAGLLLGLALAFGTEQFDKRLRTPEEVERETGLQLLATVPKSRALRRRASASDLLDPRDTEPFRRLASKLRHLEGDRQIRSVLVTSPGPGSGKTTVALHLAAAAADGIGRNVCLVEADLRRPQLSSLLSLPGKEGLSTVLQSEHVNGGAVQTLALSGTPVGGNGHGADVQTNLSVLLAGPPATDPTRLLESDAMRDLMRSWQSRYELTVVDGPPPGYVADAIPLAKEVDAVILVARLGQDTGAGLRHLRLEFERLGIEPLGVVVNYARRVKNPYAYSGR